MVVFCLIVFDSILIDFYKFFEFIGVNTVPDEDRGFLLSANFCKPKKVISSRSSTKRKIMVEIRVE